MIETSVWFHSVALKGQHGKQDHLTSEGRKHVSLKAVSVSFLVESQFCLTWFCVSNDRVMMTAPR